MDSAFKNLRPDMTLDDLPSDRVLVSPETRGQDVFDFLNARHSLPGVIIGSAERIDGVLSRTRFMELLSTPFGLDFFQRRPIRAVLESTRGNVLSLPASLGVHDAARAALNRPTDSVFEPVVVTTPGRVGDWRLLDVHTLLLAQSALLQLAHETVERQKSAAESANHAKSQFLANMSHEIRTPLTAILGFAENLLDPAMSETERKAAVRTIVRNGEHLLEIINGILDLAKIEAGRLEVEHIRFSPVRLVADVVSAMRVRSDAQRLALHLAWETPVPESIESDPTRLRQILINLLGNAIKFTQAGSVTLHVSFRPLPQGNSRLAFVVVDTGIGMDDSQVARLFQPFSQADQSMARRFGGTGLGLAISQRLAGMLGGDISVQSRAGEGTTFRFHVAAGSVDGVRMLERPAEELAIESETSAAEAPESLRGRILLAEDSPDNQLLISTFLRKSGAEVVVVGNGALACEAALAAQRDGVRFDVILMDMQMPVLDGYEATRRLRSSGYDGPIIALTANAMRGDQKQCRDAGCNDYATKPIHRRQLLGQIARQIRPSNEGSSHRAPESRATCRSDESRVSQSCGAAGVHIDFETALSRAGGDADLLRDLGIILLESTPEWMTGLDESRRRNDLPTLRRLAHTLKSAADNLGCKTARTAAERLESIAAEGRTAELETAFSELRETWDRFLPLVEELAMCRV